METLSPDELAYHRALVARVKAAQVAQAAWQSWSEHLSAKYRLAERDAISETGDIVRTEPPSVEEAAEPA